MSRVLLLTYKVSSGDDYQLCGIYYFIIRKDTPGTACLFSACSFTLSVDDDGIMVLLQAMRTDSLKCVYSDVASRIF